MSNTLPKSTSTAPHKGTYNMKKVLEFLFALGESMGKARAAAMFTRMGNYEAAKKVMAD